MENMDIEVLRSASAWLTTGHAGMLATVVATWGSAPRPVGALVAIRDDGQICGSVSGGCVEDDLIERCRELLAGASRPSTVAYGVSREEATRFGLPCGGTLKLVLEPLSANSRLDELLARIGDGRELVNRRLDLASAAVELAPATPFDRLYFDGATLKTVFGPQWRLLIIGAGQASRYLADMAAALGYQVEICDPRQEYAAACQVAGVAIARDYPDDFILAQRPDPHTAVVALTHDPKLDDAALLEALKSPAFYVGALGSHKNNAARRERLALFDLTPAEIGRLHGPVGLTIGSRTPPEIAVSVLAHLIAVRSGATDAAAGHV